MEKREFELEGRKITMYGSAGARFTLIQPSDEQDLSGMDGEVQAVAETTGTEDFCLAAVGVRNWNGELSPWEAPPVFGSEGFGSGAGEMLLYITEKLLPHLAGEREKALGNTKGSYAGTAGPAVFLGGYSLAGFFALWSAYQTALFDGVAAVSPSVWFPGWTEYASGHSCRTPAGYLSLGDREERTRNRTMAQVGDAIREQYRKLSSEGVPSVLEWNPGNHFRDAGLRTAKGFSWLILRDLEAEPEEEKKGALQ